MTVQLGLTLIPTEGYVRTGTRYERPIGMGLWLRLMDQHMGAMNQSPLLWDPEGPATIPGVTGDAISRNGENHSEDMPSKILYY